MKQSKSQSNKVQDQARQAGGYARANTLSAERRKEIAAIGGIAKGKSYQQKKAMSEGGKKSLVTLSAEQRRERAKKAALTRWGKSEK